MNINEQSQSFIYKKKTNPNKRKTEEEQANAKNLSKVQEELSENVTVNANNIVEN